MLHSRSLRRSRGFTLVELLVVVAIMASLALVAIPWFAKISQHGIVKSAAQEISITLAAARIRAVKRNLPARVLVTRGGALQPFHRIQTFEETSPEKKVGEFLLSNRVDFPVGLQPTGNQIVFGPDGRATSLGAYTIRGVIGAAATNDITVAVAANGKITVTPPTDWK